MPRPRIHSDDDLLDATARALARLGPADLTVAAVAAEAGCSPAAVVRRFGSRRELLRALTRREADRVRLDPADDSPEALVDALCRLAAPLGDPAAFPHHLAALAADLADPELAAETARYLTRVRDQVANHLAVSHRWRLPTGELAELVMTTYHGALVAGAATGSDPLWRLRADLTAVLGLARAGESSTAQPRAPRA